MTNKDKFVAKIKAQLDELTAEVHELESKVENAGADVRDKSRQAIEALHEKRVMAEMKLEEIRHEGEDSWEELKDEAERAWVAFKASIDAFRDFSDHS